MPPVNRHWTGAAQGTAATDTCGSPIAAPGPSVTAFIGLGANLGDGPAALRSALDALEVRADTSVVKVSSLYRSAPVEASGPDYVNAVAQLCTALRPHDLLAVLMLIEQRAGRERPYRNAPRTLDLDLLLVDDLYVETTTLTVPHPRMWERAFVVLPLAEICPVCVSPQQLARVAGQVIQRCESLCEEALLKK